LPDQKGIKTFSAFFEVKLYTYVQETDFAILKLAMLNKCSGLSINDHECDDLTNLSAVLSADPFKL